MKTLILIFAFLITVLPLTVQGQLLIVSSSNFNTDSAWSIDIDGDGVDELAASTTSENVIRTADFLNNFSTFPNGSSGIGGVLSPNTPISGLDGTFTAASSNALNTDNKSTDGQWLNSATLWHGTSTSGLTNAVSLIGWLIEPPTTGSSVGYASGINHNNNYYVYYHDFGDVGAGQSISVDYSTDILSSSAVPEPSTYAFLTGFMALGLAATARRKRC